MEQNRLLLEAELKALMEVSSDFTRGLSTVKARMEVLKSCLDKSLGGHVSRVDRATSPILFCTDRSTSVSPLRFKSPVKFKEEKVDIQETIADNPAERNYCDINEETNLSNVNNEHIIDNYEQNRMSVVVPEEQFIQVNCDEVLPDDSGAFIGSNDQLTITVPPEYNFENGARKSYYVVNPTTGIAIPIDASQIKDFGLSKSPIQRIYTVQHRKPIEEDILYAMQANKRRSFIDTYKTLGTAGVTTEQEILLSSEDENETVRKMNPERVFAARFALEKKREYNRVRQARYRAKRGGRCSTETENTKNTANSPNIISKSSVNIGGDAIISPKMFTLRKELIKKTYTRGHRNAETS